MVIIHAAAFLDTHMATITNYFHEIYLLVYNVI
jgi:hypothetical protein